jgi:tetratricopeptide (TPR) repeat protein
MASSGRADGAASWTAAEAAARRALELDPRLGDAHTSLAMAELFHNWDADAAYAEIQKGIGLNPGSAVARHAFGIYLIVIGEAERAIEEMELAARLDPLSMLMLGSLAWAQLEAGRYADVLQLSDRILSMDPMFRTAHESKGTALQQLGRFDEAAVQFQRVVDITGDRFKGLAQRGHNFALMGRTADARQALEMLHERARDHPEQSLEIDFAMVHAALGELDDALRYLDAAARKRLGGVLFSVNGASWKGVRQDPRYRALIGHYGLMRISRDTPVRPAVSL